MREFRGGSVLRTTEKRVNPEELRVRAKCRVGRRWGQAGGGWSFGEKRADSRPAGRELSSSGTAHGCGVRVGLYRLPILPPRGCCREISAMRLQSSPKLMPTAAAALGKREAEVMPGMVLISRT